jgi:hypothetical protein
MVDHHKPFPIRLGKVKPILQQYAVEQDRSLSWLIRKILNDYVESKNGNGQKPFKR